MNELLNILCKNLDTKIRYALNSRYENLARGISYLAQKQHHFWLLAEKKGWSLQKIDIVCALNAFYQVVLGPLSSSTFSKSKSGLITNSPIRFGRLLITSDDIKEIQKCHNKFEEIIAELNIDFWALQANHYQDLLYRLARPWEEQDNEFE